MPHRDHEHPPAPASHAQDLRQVFQWLLTDLDWGGIDFRKDSSFSVRGLILVALLWAWSDEVGLMRRCTAARKIGHRLWPAEVPAKVSYQAFMKRLVNWTTVLSARLAEALRRRTRTALKSRFHIAGFVLFGVDGSRLELPRTESNEKRFSPASTQGKARKTKRRNKGKKLPKRRKRPHSIAAKAKRSRQKKADSPQMWITTMWHAGTGLPWDWRTGPSDSSERAHMIEMVEALPEDAMITADAGFVGYSYWSALLGSGREFLIRVGGNVRLLKKLGYARESGDTVSLWPDREARRSQAPLVLRLVIVHDGKQPWYLVTSVREASRLSDRQIAELYRRRWGIELFYRHFKQTFGRRKLRSHTAGHLECEAAWSMLGLWAMLLHALTQLHRRHVPPERLSVANVLHAYRQSMREYKSFPDPGESLWDLLKVAIIDDYQRTNKQSRAHPRKKYEEPTKPPTITLATPEQIERAQQYRREKVQKGLTA